MDVGDSGRKLSLEQGVATVPMGTGLRSSVVMYGAVVRMTCGAGSKSTVQSRLTRSKLTGHTGLWVHDVIDW